MPLQDAGLGDLEKVGGKNASLGEMIRNLQAMGVRIPGGFIITTLLGIAGAFVAKYIGVAMGYYRPEDSTGFIASVVGAIIILAIFHLFRRKRVTT